MSVIFIRYSFLEEDVIYYIGKRSINCIKIKKSTLKNYHKISLDYSINCFSMDAPKCITTLNPSFNNCIRNNICHNLLICVTGMGGGRKEEI
jgi:hypothetical protein